MTAQPNPPYLRIQCSDSCVQPRRRNHVDVQHEEVAGSDVSDGEVTECVNRVILRSRILMRLSSVRACVFICLWVFVFSLVCVCAYVSACSCNMIHVLHVCMCVYVCVCACVDQVKDIDAGGQAKAEGTRAYIPF